MTRRLAVFDVDGTLVDSRATIQRCMTIAFAHLGLPAPAYDLTRQVVGLNLAEALDILAGGLGPDDRVRLTRAYSEAFVNVHAEPGYGEPLYPGAAELLDRLRAEGWLIAMATGKSRKGVERVIRTHGWADLFDSTHCADDGPGKPDPAMLLECMKVLQTPPHLTVMIGDTAHDMRMAKAARVRAQGVTWGFHTAGEVLAGGADHVAESFEELRLELQRFQEAVDA